MSQPPDLEARLAALEARVDAVAADATADLSVKVDANRSAINALGQQTAAGLADLREHMDRGFAEVDRRFAQVDRGFTEVDRGFTEVRGKLDQAAAGQAHIADLLTRLIARQDEQ